MVKIRLRRTGTKGRPFYRVVVAHSTDGRNGNFVEVIGTYDPVVKPSKIAIDTEKALDWLLKGAQPTETAAYILNKVGVLEQLFAQRPEAKKQYKFLDKRTAAMSVKSVIEQPAAPAPAPAPAPEPTPEPEAAPVVEEAQPETVADEKSE